MFVMANNIQDLILLVSLNIYVPGLLAEYFEGFELMVFNFNYVYEKIYEYSPQWL